MAEIKLKVRDVIHTFAISKLKAAQIQVAKIIEIILEKIFKFLLETLDTKKVSLVLCRMENIKWE